MEGVALSSLPGPSLRFVPTLPWFPLEERKLGGSGKAWRQNTRVEEAWSQDLHLPWPGSNRAKACMVLAQAPTPVCFCGACWDWPFTCPSRSGWLKRWAIVLGTHYALTVWLKYFHCAEAGRWVDFGMLLFSWEKLFSLSLGGILLFPSVTQIVVPDAETHLNLSKNCQEVM